MIRFLMFLLFAFCIGYSQENLEPYMLTDSLDILALVNTPPDQQTEPKTAVGIHTSFGLSVRNLRQISDLNFALDTLGYGQIPETLLGWSFGNRIDIGDHWTVGFSYLSNYYLGGYNAGATGTSKLTYFNVIFDIGYRYHWGGLTLMPEMGLGISSTILSFKPNDTSTLSWVEFHENSELTSVLTQNSLSLSAGFGFSHTIPWLGGKSRLLSLRTGLLFNPFVFNNLGVNNGEWSFVKISEAPDVSNSGVYLILTIGSGKP